MAKRALAYVVSLTLEGELRESCLLTMPIFYIVLFVTASPNSGQ